VRSRPIFPVRRLALAAALAVTAGGCALTFDARSLGVPATMAVPAGQPVVGDTFRVTTKAMHMFWGLYPARTPNLRNVLAGQLAGGGSVQNLRIRARKRWSDVLVTVLFVGVFSPTSVTFEGVVTRSGP
jgi:hypothetical protein